MRRMPVPTFYRQTPCSSCSQPVSMKRRTNPRGVRQASKCVVGTLSLIEKQVGGQPNLLTMFSYFRPHSNIPWGFIPRHAGKA